MPIGTGRKSNGEIGLPNAGLCQQCDYSLIGLDVPRCPECGRAFDPADPATVNMGRPLGRVGRWLLRPVGWPTYLVAGLISALWMYSWALPNGSFGLWVLASYASMPVVGWWALRLVASIIAVLWLRQPKKRCLTYWRRWTVLPLLAGVLVGLGHTAIPYHVGLFISRPWLDRIANQAVAKYGPQAPSASDDWERRYVSRWAGIYHIDAIDVRKDGVRLSIGVSGNLFDRDSGLEVRPGTADNTVGKLEWRTWSTSGLQIFGQVPLDYKVVGDADAQK